jgi:hypothetical protein
VVIATNPQRTATQRASIFVALAKCWGNVVRGDAELAPAFVAEQTRDAAELVYGDPLTPGGIRVVPYGDPLRGLAKTFLAGQALEHAQ